MKVVMWLDKLDNAVEQHKSCIKPVSSGWVKRGVVLRRWRANKKSLNPLFTRT